jgi:hypothetical protein
MRYPAVAASIAAVAAVATLNAPLEVSEQTQSPTELPVLVKTIAG